MTYVLMATMPGLTVLAEELSEEILVEELMDAAIPESRTSIQSIRFSQSINYR